MLLVAITYSMHDLICDFTNCCALSIDMGKISVYDEKRK